MMILLLIASQAGHRAAEILKMKILYARKYFSFQYYNGLVKLSPYSRPKKSIKGCMHQTCILCFRCFYKIETENVYLSVLFTFYTIFFCLSRARLTNRSTDSYFIFCYTNYSTCTCIGYCSSFIFTSVFAI